MTYSDYPKDDFDWESEEPVSTPPAEGAWSLQHYPGVFTPWHHDAQGKVTFAHVLTGVKIWTAFIPGLLMTPYGFENVTKKLCEKQFIMPDILEGTVKTFVLYPGDILLV